MTTEAHPSVEFRTDAEYSAFEELYRETSGPAMTQREVAKSAWFAAREYFDTPTLATLAQASGIQTGFREAYLQGGAVEGDFKLLSVDDFIATRSYIQRELARANPRSNADFSGAAERLMKLGIIDFRAIDRLLHPAPEVTIAQMSDKLDRREAIADAIFDGKEPSA